MSGSWRAGPIPTIGATASNGSGYTNLEGYLHELAAPAFPEGYLDARYELNWDDR